MNTISASRVAAVLGQSKWQTRLALFHEMTGAAPPQDDNELLTEGREFEDTIAEIACRKFGMTIVEGPSQLIRHPLSGHPDRYVRVNGKLAILEVKNTLFADEGTEIGGWGRPGTDEVPPAYLLQCQVYGYLLRSLHPEGAAEEVYLAARLRSGVQLYVIRIDAELIAKIELECSRFLDLVARNEPPLPETYADAMHRWMPTDRVAEATIAQVVWMRQHAALGKQIRDLEKQRADIGMMILSWMQDAGSATYSGTQIATAKTNRELDEAAFTAANPSLAARYVKLDRTALKKAAPSIYDQFCHAPQNAVDQTRVLRIREDKLPEV